MLSIINIICIIVLWNSLFLLNEESFVLLSFFLFVFISKENVSEPISEVLDNQSNLLVADVTYTLNSYNNKYREDFVFGFKISNKMFNKVLCLHETNYLIMLNYKIKAVKHITFILHNLIKSKLSTIKILENWSNILLVSVFQFHFSEANTRLNTYFKQYPSSYTRLLNLL